MALIIIVSMCIGFNIAAISFYDGDYPIFIKSGFTVALILCVAGLYKMII